jgi:DNA topoisomerase-1
MSSDSAALSDDDRVLVLKTAPNGRHHGTHTNGNGHLNANDEDLSEDNDLPLVRYLLYNRCH